jgi:hypothetical protein
MLHLLRQLSIVFVIALTGCAASVQQTPTSSPQASVAVQSGSAAMPAGTLTAIVTGNPSMTSSSDWPAFLDEWKEALTASAEAARMSFVLANDEANIPPGTSRLVRLTVNDFRYVSTTKRFMIGIMAGNAFMDVDAQYIAPPATTPFTSKKFNTSSSAWEGIFSAVTPKQVRAVSEMIVKDLTTASPPK